MIDCVILVVAYRSAADVLQLVETIPDAVDALSWHVLVIDNWGKDGLAGALSGNARVTVIPSGGNLGYAGGLNVGIRHAPASRFTIFLNPDLTLAPGALATLVETCEMNRVGASVPLVLDEHDRVQPSLRREPSVVGSLGEAVFGDRWADRPLWLAEMIRAEARYTVPSAIDWATGAALVVRSDLVAKIGPWDSQRFFLYSEETDYARRIRELGEVIRFEPRAVVRHRGAGSGSSARLDALLAVNKVRYYRKWHGAAASAAFFGVSLVHNTLRFRRPEARLALRALLSKRTRAALPPAVVAS